MKRTLSVNIAGQKYSIKSDAEERYVHSLASMVDQKIKEVGRASKSVATQSLAVLAALQIADELMRERKGRQELRRKVREKSRSIQAYLDRELKS